MQVPRSALAILVTGLLLSVACGGGAPAGTSAPTAPTIAATTEPFNEAVLLAAAKNEPALVALNNSGIVTTLAAEFEKKYGLKVNGTKADSPTQVQQVTREVQSGNVTLGVLSIEDGALVQAQLIPQKIVTNYVPPDMAKSIAAEWQNPLVQLWDAKVIGYNPDSYSSCPITNIWDLTDAKWKGKTSIRDPLGTPEQITWFSWLVADDNAAKLATAYQQKYGAALQTTEKNAGYEFIKRWAANKPITGKSDDDTAAAVGAPGQKDAPVGVMSLGKFGEAPGKGNKLAVCKGVTPWIGYAYPRYAVMVTNTPSPNAAKLYLHFLMTADGAGPSINDHGGFSANTDVAPGKNEFVGTRDEWQRSLVFLAPSGNDRGWQLRTPLTDLWRLNKI